MFTRDIVVFDTETTGLDISKHELIQIAAIRLDKDNLAEKNRYESFIKPSHWETQNPKAAEVHQISYDTVKDAPTPEVVLAEFEQAFPPTEVLLSAYNFPFDFSFLYDTYRKLGKQCPYDFHGVDIWAFAYYFWSNTAHTINPEKRNGFGLSDVASMLGIINSGTYHQAMVDCEVEVEVLRRLLAKLKLV